MFMGQDGFVWWIGVVEDNNDPLLLGRARVRIFGYHPKVKQVETYSPTANNSIPTGFLPWAIPILPLNLPNAYGKISVGQWVFGFFLDGEASQEPAMLGYIPAAYAQKEFDFGKYPTPRNFQDLSGTIPDGEYKNTDFAVKSNRFEFHTPDNHFIRMLDSAAADKQKEFTLSHAQANLFVAMKGYADGTHNLTVSHPKTSIQLTETDIIVSGPGGTWPLIDQLNWISLQIHETGRGSKRGSRKFTIGKRPAPPPPPPVFVPGSSPGCFIPSALITLADGSKKKISDIEVGDMVLNRSKTSCNRVRFIEVVRGERHKMLYSPKPHRKPFATIEHPIYINDTLCSVDPILTEEMYPWLGKTESLYLPMTTKNTHDKVYNLWVDGDGTYIVNNYGTTSIIFDGGMLSDFLEKEYFSAEFINELFEEYTSNGQTLLHGAFVLNYLIGKYDIQILRDFFAYSAKKSKDSIMRKLTATVPMLIVGFVVDATSKLHKWRFIK